MSSEGDQGHGTSITSLLPRCSPAHEGTRRPHTQGLTTSWAITSRPPCQDPTMPITGAAGLMAQDRSGWSLSRPPSSDPAGLAIMSLVILPTHGLDSRPSCPLWPHQSLVRPNSAHPRISPQAQVHQDSDSQRDPDNPGVTHEAHLPQSPVALSCPGQVPQRGAFYLDFQLSNPAATSYGDHPVLGAV